MVFVFQDAKVMRLQIFCGWTMLTRLGSFSHLWGAWHSDIATGFLVLYAMQYWHLHNMWLHAISLPLLITKVISAIQALCQQSGLRYQ